MRQLRDTTIVGRILAIKALSQFLSSLEERHELLINRYRSTGPWIASDSRCTILHREGTKASELNSVASCQRLDNLIKDDINNALHVSLVKMWVCCGDLLDEF